MCFGCLLLAMGSSLVYLSVDDFSSVSMGRVVVLLTENYATPALGLASWVENINGRTAGNGLKDHYETTRRGRFEHPLLM